MITITFDQLIIAGLLLFIAHEVVLIKNQLQARHNSKEGQRIIEESETLRTGLGTLNYHLQAAASLKEAAKSHEAEAAAIAERLQTEAKNAQGRLTR